jgi:hypothetical protein
MPKAPAVPLPTTVTSGQLARLIGRTERVINGRKADGRLPIAPGGGIDLARVVQAGVTALARQDFRDGARTNREAFNVAVFAVECAVSAMAAPWRGEDAPAAAARGLAYALSADDYFEPPADWKAPTRVEPDPGLLFAEDEDAANPAEDRAPVPPRLVVVAGTG